MPADVIYSVVVDKADVLRILHAVDESIDAPSLAQFLQVEVREWWRQRELELFAHEGDAGGGGSGMFGGWAELSPATQNIRHYLGYEEDSPINVRSGEMLYALLESYDLGYVPGGASITIPGGSADPLTAEKIRTAQQGKTGETPSGSPSITPPRPVLGLGESDAVAVLELLNLHLIQQIAGGLA